MPAPTTPPRSDARPVHRPRPLLLVAVALAVLAVLTPSLAHAEVVTIHDREGDGARNSSGTGPRIYGDVASVRTNYTDDELTLKVGHGEQGRFGND